MTSHFELSTITGTRAMSGSPAIRFKKLFHRGLRIEHALVHVDVDDLRAVLDLLARHAERFFEIAGEDQLGELRRAGHVGALADVDEVGFGPDRQRFEPAQARVGFDLGGTRGAIPLHGGWPAP